MGFFMNIGGAALHGFLMPACIGVYFLEGWQGHDFWPCPASSVHCINVCSSILLFPHDYQQGLSGR
jgi:hypothetical protein